jgi:hypothetical protein
MAVFPSLLVLKILYYFKDREKAKSTLPLAINTFVMLSKLPLIFTIYIFQSIICNVFLRVQSDKNNTV